MRGGDPLGDPPGWSPEGIPRGNSWEDPLGGSPRLTPWGGYLGGTVRGGGGREEECQGDVPAVPVETAAYTYRTTLQSKAAAHIPKTVRVPGNILVDPPHNLEIKPQSSSTQECTTLF